jgi:hypothetical protein
MSDYLTNLIVRNREENLTVRPRLTSLFEPARSFTLSEAEQTTEESDVLMPGQSQKMLAARPDRVDSLTPAPAVIQSRAKQNSATNVSEASPPKHERESNSTVRETRQERQTITANVSEPTEPYRPVVAAPVLPAAEAQLIPRDTESSAMNESSGREKSDQNRTDSPPEKSHVTARVIGHLAVPPQSRERTDPSESVELSFAKPVNLISADAEPRSTARTVTNNELPTAPAPIVLRSRPESAEPVIEGEHPRRTIEPTTSLVTKPATRAESIGPIIPRVTTRAPLMPESIRAESSASIINVTIGRVEVRAAPAVISTPKPSGSRNESKLMSLDDYLSQRAQGGRR